MFFSAAESIPPEFVAHPNQDVGERECKPPCTASSLPWIYEEKIKKGKKVNNPVTCNSFSVFTKC
jgi:hypothetical protein